MSSKRDAGKSGAVDETGGKALSRRTFLKSTGGVATGLAVTSVPAAALGLVAPAAASAAPDRLGKRVDPTGDVPSEPVMAYVHDAGKGEVTVVSGTTERTYRDPILAKRLLDAADDQTV